MNRPEFSMKDLIKILERAEKDFDKLPKIEQKRRLKWLESDNQ